MFMYLPGWSWSLITQDDRLEWSRPLAQLASVILYCFPIWENQTAKFLVVGSVNGTPCLITKGNVWTFIYIMLTYYYSLLISLLCLYCAFPVMRRNPKCVLRLLSLNPLRCVSLGWSLLLGTVSVHEVLVQVCHRLRTNTLHQRVARYLGVLAAIHSLKFWASRRGEVDKLVLFRNVGAPCFPDLVLQLIIIFFILSISI